MLVNVLILYQAVAIDIILVFLLCSIEEIEILKELVEKALACKTRLEEVVNNALAFVDKDLCIISGKLTAALKVCCVNHYIVVLYCTPL